MEKDIFENYLIDLKERESPEGAVSYAGTYIAGETEVQITIDLKRQDGPEVVRLKAEKEYHFEILPSSCGNFNREMQETYGNTYNIYGHRNTFHMVKRTIIEPDYGIENICEEFFQILCETVRMFEKMCVNFMQKYTALETEHDVSPEIQKKTDTVMDELPGEPGYIASYMKEKKEYVQKVFAKLADSCSAVIEFSDNGDQYFYAKEDGGQFHVFLEKEAADVKVTYEVQMALVRGYAFAANVTATYPEYAVDYKDGTLSITAYVTPDEFLPDGAEETVRMLLEAFKVCDRLTVAEPNGIEADTMTADLKIIMDSQMKGLETREKELDEREEMIKTQEAAFHEQVLRFEQEKKKQVDVIQNKIHELTEKEENLSASMEKHLNEKQDFEDQKKKYQNQSENIAAELKRLRTRVECSAHESDSFEEVKKLQSKLASMTKARAAMERQLRMELEVSQERVRQLLRDIQAREREISELKEDFTVRSRQLLGEERENYEKEIRELKEMANITEYEINTDSLKKYVDEKTEFQNAVIQHAKDKEIIAIQHEMFVIKIVLGKMLFVDVTRTFRKAVDLKTVSAMNNQFSGIKFFMNGKNVVTAREYFGRQTLNAELVQIIRNLMGNFE